MKYTKEELIESIKRFEKEFGRVPLQNDFENKIKNYPSRKTFTNYFDTFDEAIELAGFKIIKNYISKDELINVVSILYNQNKIAPIIDDITKVIGFDSRQWIRKYFHSYDKMLKIINIKSNVISYTDDELKEHFLRFVDENGRTPVIKDFLNTNGKYPSFDTYQTRYGSWNKAFEMFGFESNDSNRQYVFEDGEICKSSYEHDVSKWLRDNKISYKRNVKYRELFKDYVGKKDCDYVIKHGKTVFLIEVAGFMKYNSAPTSSVEIDYTRRFIEKEDMVYECIEKDNSGYSYEFYNIFGDEFKEPIDDVMEFLGIRMVL